MVGKVASTARGSIHVLERLFDGVSIGVELTAWTAGAASLAICSAVTIGVVAADIIVSAEGEAVAFVTNEVGRAPLYDKSLAHRISIACPLCRCVSSVGARLRY